VNIDYVIIQQTLINKHLWPVSTNLYKLEKTFTSNLMFFN